MKLVRCMLPLSILAIAGIVCTVLLNPVQSGGEENQLAFAIGALFIYLLNILPLVLYIPFAVVLLICELCLFFVHNPLATMIAAIVFKCLLLPILLFTVVTMGSMILSASLLFGVLIIASAAVYGLSLILTFVGYFKERSYYRY